ncbi:MAG: hypothetical protein ACO2PM_23480 [Pyrobaculum sp.]
MPSSGRPAPAKRLRQHLRREVHRDQMLRPRRGGAGGDAETPPAAAVLGGGG